MIVFTSCKTDSVRRDGEKSQSTGFAATENTFAVVVYRAGALQARTHTETPSAAVKRGVDADSSSTMANRQETKVTARPTGFVK